MTLRGRLVLALLRVARLPRLEPVAVDATTERRFQAVADRLLDGRAAELPEQRLDFLRWLAQRGTVVFHGSPSGNLAELHTERETRDATPWGDQQAVYATTDPVWAIYFACNVRGAPGFRSTRNGSMGRAGSSLYPREYFFSHNRGSQPAWADGWLYLLPPDPFEPEPLLAGVIDTAQLVSRVPVRPLARVAVSPEDFPFRERISFHREREPIWLSLVRYGCLH
jgi:hypothetical protein